MATTTAERGAWGSDPLYWCRVKVLIGQVRSSLDEQRSPFIGEHPISRVELVGLVTERYSAPTKIQFVCACELSIYQSRAPGSRGSLSCAVDDGTGRMSCTLWVNDQHEQLRHLDEPVRAECGEQIRRGALVRVHGKLSTKRERIELVVFSARTSDKPQSMWYGMVRSSAIV